MAYKKYTEAQKRMACKMYWNGRPKAGFDGEYRKGKYTLAEISKITGVSIQMIHKAAHSKRGEYGPQST